MKSDYIPNGDAQFDAWETNFVTKLTALAATLGLSPAEVTAITAAITTHHTTYNSVIAAKAAAKGAVTANRTTRSDTEDAVRLFVKNKIKASDSYTDAMGQQLGIIGSETTTDWSTAKPTIRAEVSGGSFPDIPQVIIHWDKKQADGIFIFSRRGFDQNFEMIGTDSFPPYEDTRPRQNITQPEQRWYYAMYVVKDQMVGLPSDIVTAMI